jgi:hypothetical protein
MSDTICSPIQWFALRLAVNVMIEIRRQVVGNADKARIPARHVCLDDPR